MWAGLLAGDLYINRQSAFRPHCRFETRRGRSTPPRKIHNMNSNVMDTLSQDDDTVGRWVNSLVSPITDLEMDIKEPEKMTDDSATNPNSENEKKMDEPIDNFEYFEIDNAQRITTQDLMVPSPIVKDGRITTQDPMAPSPIVKDTRKRRFENKGESRYNSLSVKIPAWLRAENGLRLAYWNSTKLRKILNTCYIVPDSDDLSCYHLAEGKFPYFVRIVCSGFDPHKIVIGSRGKNNKKCEFATPHLDLLISALTSLIKGSKAKTISLGNRGEKLKIEISNGYLNFAHTFPADIKKFVQNNNMGSYLAPDDCYFNIPSSEIDNFLATLMDAVQFVRLQADIISQRKMVFETAVREMKQAAVLRQNECLAMSSYQFAIKLFEIYYSMDFPPTERYPFSIVLSEYYKMLSHVF